ncbi:hypothetical protein WJX74_003186 [Apatococcus lobatus]|uniref:Cytochrome P450 n=1 Tax=Apatococcus lobatus TaxID=904363 RepID=A0AAW1S3A4_9CHLO
MAHKAVEIGSPGDTTADLKTVSAQSTWEPAQRQVSGLGTRMSAYKEVALQQAQRLKDEYQRFRTSQTSAPAPAPTQDGYTLHARKHASASSPMRHLPRTIPRPQTGLGWAVLALVVAALAKSVFGLQLPGWLRGGQGTQGGRWIKDRSLGGKMVFIPDEEVAAGKKQQPFDDWSVQSAPARSSPTAATDRSQSGAAASTSAPAAFGAGPQTAQQQSRVQRLPDWWDPPPVIHSSGAFKEEAKKRAQSLTNTMEEGKLAGRDPTLEQLVSLRQTCAEMQIVVKTRTPQGRDTLLRIAADGAINAAMDQNLLMLNGIQPQRFIAGIAVDLGIPDEKAGTIAHGAVAAQLARVLQDVYLAIRAGREDEVLLPLLRIHTLLQTLPLPQASAEAAMVGDNISSKASLDERQAIFYMFGVMHRPSAGTMAALLGFNPKLVLPHLDNELSKRGRLDLDSMPSPPARLFTGHMTQLLAPNFHRVFTAWAQRYGTVYRISILGFPGVVVSDPAVIGQLLGYGTEGGELPKNVDSYQQLDRLWGGENSIFTDLNTNLQRVVRKATATSFSSSSLRQHFPLLQKKSQQLTDAIALHAGKAVDLDEAGMRVACDVVGQASFGHDFKSVDFSDARVIKVLPRGLEECQKRMTNPIQRLLNFTKDAREADACMDEYGNIIKGIVKEMKARGPPEADDLSVGAQLLRAKDPATGLGLTDKQLQAEVGTFIMGGFETTAHTLSFTLFCIASNPDVEEKIAEELRDLGLLKADGSLGRPVSADDLNMLSYLSNVIKESMRMFPVVAGFPRRTDKVTQIGQYRVPKNVFVYILFHHLHNSPDLWDHASVFDPTRWEDPSDPTYVQDDSMHAHSDPFKGQTDTTGKSSKGTINLTASASIEQPTGSGDFVGKTPKKGMDARPKKYFPFSAGPRSCIGQGMANMVLKTVIATLCARFTLRLADEMGGPEGVAASEVMALTLHTHHGILMHCTERAPAAC